jgi:hypothetical protein
MQELKAADAALREQQAAQVAKLEAVTAREADLRSSHLDSQLSVREQEHQLVLKAESLRAAEHQLEAQQQELQAAREKLEQEQASAQDALQEVGDRLLLRQAFPST